MRSRLMRVVGLLAGVAIAIVLWRWSDPGDESEFLHGGPLFDFAVADVARLELRRAAGRSEIVRTGRGWSLRGQVDDLVDDERLAEVLTTLVSGAGLPVLPGTEPSERRFGFADEDAVELVFHLRDGSRHRLALGDPAPVSNQVYASGAGRTGVFGVDGTVYLAAAKLPDNVRYPRLLPPVEFATLDSLRIERRDDAPLDFRRGDDGRWWVRPPDGLEGLTGLAATYQRAHVDRRRTDAGAVWVQASRRRLAEVVFRATITDVMGFPPPAGLTAEHLADLGLEPPYRAVMLHAPRRTRRVAFGEYREGPIIGARREGAVVLTRAEALPAVEGPLSEFLDLTALGFALGDRDSFRLDADDRPLLWARRADPPAEFSVKSRSPWDPIVPDGWRLGFEREAIANHLHDLQVYLDRLAIGAVLDDAATNPLRPGRRWRLRAWRGDDRAVVWLGERSADGRPALWDPATDRVVAVDGEILTSLRSVRADLRAEQ